MKPLLTIFGIKEPGKPFTFHNWDTVVQHLDSLPDGRYKMELSKCYRKATHPQFSYLYGIVYPMALARFLELGYDEFKDVDDVDVMFKWKFANKPIIDFETGHKITLPMNKAQFVTIDQMAYCDKVRQWCSEFLDIDIPEPKKKDE